MKRLILVFPALIFEVSFEGERDAFTEVSSEVFGQRTGGRVT